MPWLLLMLLLILPPAMAADAAQPSQIEVQQKLQLLKMLLPGSSMTERSVDDAPHTFNTQANDAFSAGDFELADTLANKALSAIEDATRQSAGASKVELARYADMLEDVLSLEATYLDLYKTLSKVEKQTFDVLVGRAPPLIAQAQELTRDRHYSEALERLETVHVIYVAAINKIVADTAVVYDNQFDSPAEEYEYELARYIGYEELLPLAKKQFQPSPGVLQLSERYVADSQKMRKQAQQGATNSDFKSAIKTMQNATKRLQTALKAIGLTVPE